MPGRVMAIKIPRVSFHSTVTKTTLADQAMPEALWENIEVISRQDSSPPCYISQRQPHEVNVDSFLQINVQTQTNDFSVS